MLGRGKDKREHLTQTVITQHVVNIEKSQTVLTTVDTPGFGGAINTD